MNNTLVNNGAKFSGALGSEIERSAFDLKWRDMTTCSVGALYPIMFEEVIPGDKFKIDTAITSIMQPSIYPTCDDIVADVHYFYCPFRILWKNFRKFIGEEIPSDYDDQEALVMPHFSSSGATESFVHVGDLLDRLGIQPGVKADGANSLPYRMYRFVWNEWYRSSEIQDPVLVDRDADVDTDYIPYLLKVNRFKDYFSSCLPRPQAAAEPAIIPLTGLASVGSFSEFNDKDDYNGNTYTRFSLVDNSGVSSSISKNQMPTILYSDVYQNGLASIEAQSNISPSVSSYITPYNLGVDFENQINAVGSTVTALRQAVATQRFLEVSQRSGYRYRELIKAHYGSEIPDSTAQIPQFLGGARFNINMAANVQTSANSGDQASGSLSGVSITREKDFGINEHVFTEPGLVMGFISFRVLNHTYQQGCPRFFFKKSKFDLYWPEFSRISEQPVYKGELYLNAGGFFGDKDNFVPFGYNEAYAEYRYHPSRLSGQVRRSFEQRSLSPWTYADYYDRQPTLSSSWLTEPRENVDDTLTYIGEETSERPSGLPDVYYYDNGLVDQFVVDIAFKIRAERPMPLYGIPGLDVI